MTYLVNQETHWSGDNSSQGSTINELELDSLASVVSRVIVTCQYVRNGVLSAVRWRKDPYSVTTC